MTTKNEVIQAFLVGADAYAGSLRSENKKLYSYAALIAEWENGRIVLREPYQRSVTTNQHCNLIARALERAR